MRFRDRVFLDEAEVLAGRYIAWREMEVISYPKSQ
jgi:hypothetical protein